jgi:hypothetical protein
VVKYIIAAAIASFALAILFLVLGGMKYQDYISEVNYWHEHPCEVWMADCRVDLSRFLLQDIVTYFVGGAALVSAGLALIIINNRRKPPAVAETKT